MFTTPIQITPAGSKINLPSRILTIGSCFAQVIGQRLKDNKLAACVNPFGTVYNPLSVCKLIGYAAGQTMPAEDSYLERQGLNYHFDFHTGFSATSRPGLEAKIAETLDTIHAFLSSADWLMITLGTAFAYERTDNGQLVSNCHKMPARHFHKRLLTIEEITEHFDRMFNMLESFNPKLRFIVTLSPVRHLRDTLTDNSVSKASLRVAIAHLQQKYPDKVFYFPSYEIMMDELRDYRFYKADMIHPSEVAEDYIWQKFTETYMEEDTRRFLAEWASVRKALQHKAFHPASKEHQAFLRKTIARLQSLSKQTDVSEEIRYLEQQLL